MILGALVAAGVPLEDIRDALGRLKVEGFSLSLERATRGGVSGTRVLVRIDGKGAERRALAEFVGIVEASSLPAGTVERSCAVLRRLSEAEALAHGSGAGDAPAHELGDLDTLVDVVGSVAGLEVLGVERICASPFPSGSGVVRTEHGVLPVPSPATAALVAMANAPLTWPPAAAADTGEMVTPTGAAILTTLATFRQPTMNVQRVGYGLGSRDSSQYPNVLALWVGEEAGASTTGLALVETNLDDASGEHLGFVHERLLDQGARDVWFTPIQMKKNRPGTMLSAIVPAEMENQAVDLIMKETPTLGVRVRPLARYEAEREEVEVETSLGRLRVKVKRLEGRNVGVSPEYEACREVALEQGMPLQEVYRVVQREAEDQLLDSTG